MVSSLNAQGHVLLSVSAGIMVRNEHHSRLVCPYHTWAELDKDNPDLLGQDTEQANRFFSAAQGASGDTAGTVIGHLEQRLPDSDIGLVKVNEQVAFENVLMDTDIRPKALLRLDDVKAGDDYLFESFVTGKQRLRCLGRRFPIIRHRATAHPTLSSPPGKTHLLPPDNTGYVKLAQGVLATNTPVLKREPTIRDRVYGSVLVRCGMGGEKDKVLERGEVAGMLHYADLRELYHATPALLMYADAMDPLIDDGWRVL